MEAAVDPASLMTHPDRLVAFIYLLDQGGVDVQAYVDKATEINLAEVPKIPSDEEDEGYEEAAQLHGWAYALTGSSAKARHAVSQISDGQTPGMNGIGPDQVSDLVVEVADRIARGDQTEDDQPQEQ